MRGIHTFSIHIQSLLCPSVEVILYLCGLDFASTERVSNSSWIQLYGQGGVSARMQDMRQRLRGSAMRSAEEVCDALARSLLSVELYDRLFLHIDSATEAIPSVGTPCYS